MDKVLGGTIWVQNQELIDKSDCYFSSYTHMLLRTLSLHNIVYVLSSNSNLWTLITTRVWSFDKTPMLWIEIWTQRS